MSKILATPGGNRLKTLRESRGKTQLEVELDGSLGIGYLQRVESGKVKHPEQDTLERILTALDAYYSERRAILELFGYLVDTPLPTPSELQWAIDLCQTELTSAVFPAYLLDCAHRLLVWNQFFPRIFRPQPQFSSMSKVIFDPSKAFTQHITNQAEFFPAQIRALRYQMHLVREEAWSKTLLDEMLTTSPLFKKYWSASLAHSFYIAARPLVPLEIQLPQIGKLNFRLASEAFSQDQRFRILYYLPADPATMQQCLLWWQPIP